jgi:hypothetical protein
VTRKSHHLLDTPVNKMPQFFARNTMSQRPATGAAMLAQTSNARFTKLHECVIADNDTRLRSGEMRVRRTSIYPLAVAQDYAPSM